MNLERELALHHEATLRAIRNGRFELAEKRLNAYVKFAEAFLAAARNRGLAFSAKTARSASILDWPTPIQIAKYAWQGVEAAIKSNDQDMVGTGAYLPIQFLRMSVAKGDFLFYWQMVRIYPHILSLAYSVESSGLRPFIIDRSWRFLREFAQWVLLEALGAYEGEVKRQYLQFSLLTFSSLLKVAMDHNDVDTFGLLGRELNGLFHYSDRELILHEGQPLSQFIEAERSTIWFGFGAWVVRSQVLSNSSHVPGQPDQRLIDPAQVGDFMAVIAPNFSNIRDLSSAYHEARRRQWQDRDSYWEGWLWETLTEGEVHTIDFGKWLTWFYTVEGLRLSKSGNPLAGDIPKPDQDLQYRIKEIQANIAEIRAHPDLWVTFIPDIAVPSLETMEQVQEAAINERDKFSKAADYFLSVNELAIKEWSHLREDHIIASPLDDSRLDKFRDECIKGWNEQSWAVKLFDEFGERQERLAEPGSQYVAAHFRMPKDAFIKDPQVHYVGFGHDSGAEVGRSVSAAIIAKLEGASIRLEPEPLETVIGRAASIASTMTSPIIIVSGDFELEKRFFEDQRFTSRWRGSQSSVDNSAYLGRFGDVLVFFQLAKGGDKVLVVSLKEAGKLIHYAPPENNCQGLLIRITRTDEQEANRILEAHPDRLQGKDGKPREREEVIREMLLNAVVFVGAKFDVEIIRPDSIVLIPLTKGEDSALANR